jgi:hypothetical protein
MRAVKLDDAEMARMAADEGLEVLKPELGTKPRVYYRNLWRYSTAFIAGSVSVEADGVVDCVEGAAVSLLKDGGNVAQATTDNYGDFKFDRLADESGDYTVEVATDDGRSAKIDAHLGASVSLGEIRLSPPA